jgi:hypothetical protein
MATPIQGEIRVAARVIDFLSSGLYENAAACLKELINNSYDADATEVVVSVKPDAGVITIEDNGAGMSAEGFQRHFRNVAESRKRDDGEATDAGRPKIGKIGIGFIAANELCDEMELYSTQGGSSDLLHVTIEFGEIRDRSYPARRNPDATVTKGDYHGEVLEGPVDESFTRIYLKRLRQSAREQFVRPTTQTDSSVAKSIYGLKPESVRDLLAGLNSWDELDIYSQTRLKVGLNVPVRYLPGWAPDEYRVELQPLTDDVQGLNFRVLYDGTDLCKPTVLTDPRDSSVLQLVNFEGKHVQVSGYLFARHGTYKPLELNGVVTRVREAAVGEYDRDFLGYPKQLSPLFQDWITGEIRVEGELDEALNIDRRTFRETHPAWVELQGYFMKEFASFLSRVHRELYTVPSQQRKTEKARSAISAIRDISEKAGREISPRAAEAIQDTFTATEVPSRKDVRAALRTYSVADVYDAAIDAAKAVLPTDLAEQFIEELSRRLR